MAAIERKQYPSLDIAKFVMAMLILTQHTCNEWAHSTGLVHAFFGLGNFAVPFFFACSGFLFFTKYNQLERDGQKEYWKKWSIRIGKMYLVWSLIYFCFILFGWITNGTTIQDVFHYLHGCLVYSTYATIWFLPALWVGVSLCCLSLRYLNKDITIVIMLLLLIIGNIFGSYSNVATRPEVLSNLHEWYLDNFSTWRNGIFNGATFVFIGYLLACGSGSKISFGKSVLGTLFFGAAFLAEAFCITHFKLSTATDQGFFMAPAIFFLMLTILKLSIPQKELWIHFRNLSMLVFLGQRLFLTAIPGVLPSGVKTAIEAWPDVAIFMLFIVLVLSFAILIERLSVRYKFLKVLW